MQKEVNIAILTIVTLAAIIFGYQFVKGKNLLQNNKIFHTIYTNVTGLETGSSVSVNGMKVGTISDIVINPKNVQTIIVTIEVEDKYGYPKNTRIIQASDGVLGSKKIYLDFDHLCNDVDCAQSGDTLQGVNLNLIESLVGEGELKNQITGVIDTTLYMITDSSSGTALNQSYQSIHTSLKNMESITSRLSSILSSSEHSMIRTTKNLATLTDAFVSSQEDMKATLANMNSLTQQLKDANLGLTMQKANTAIDGAGDMMNKANESLHNLDLSFVKLNDILAKFDTNEGSLGRLFNDETLYENLESTTKNMSLLLQDMRLNPKRYVNFSLFGRGQEYTKPENDPAYDREPTPEN